MMTMRSNGFDATARQLIVGLPLFMGEIVCAGRAAGEMRGEFWMSTQRIRQAIFIAYLGIFASLIGVLPWIYLLVASFSEEVREILPFHPLWDSLVYYLFSVALNESKARVARW
jgi:hypothetical protein